MASGNSKKMELKLGRAGIIIVIVGMAALLCSAFMFGVIFGKNIDTYPEKIASIPQKVLALIWRPAKIKTIPDIVDNKPGEGQPKAGDNLDLTFYDNLTSKKGEVKNQPLTEKKMVETPPPQIDLPQPKIEAKEVDAPVAASKQSFIIQAESLKDKAKATQIHKTVAKLGYPSKIVKVDIKGKGTWYRVIATGFETKAQAQAAADKITQKTKTNCIIRHVDADKKKN